ncbi:MAG TPA: cytochrome c [Solirubrobacteraceae bacterium]|nr:cytochrome c [Solirubrobacteraceae bacterium]
MTRPPTRWERHDRVAALVVGLSVILSGLTVAGCGGSGGSQRQIPSAEQQLPGYLTGPPTPKEQLVAKGARLAITDGCSACHLSGARTRSGPTGPNFYGFAGRDVTLTNGQVVLVDESFVTRALEHPGRYTIRGYPPRLMSRVLGRLHVDLQDEPQQVAALAAFIEQVGPEA